MMHIERPALAASGRAAPEERAAAHRTPHAHTPRVHTEHVVLDIGDDRGSLVIFAPVALRGKEIELRRADDPDWRTHVDVAERRFNGRSIDAAVYPPLPAGRYRVWIDYAVDAGAILIVGGEVAQLDLRGH